MSEIRKDIKSFEELFKTGSQIKKEKEHNNINGVDAVTVPIKLLKPFPKHPFKIYTQDKLMEMAESIKQNGVIVPVIIRPIKGNDYEYEIIAGHNRVQASILAGLDSIPCCIKDVDDDTAVIIMIDTNLQQREIILPSEKAFAYKYKYEAIKSKGKRNDLTSSQVDTKLQNDDFLAKESNESKHTMYRFIRLTHLIPELLNKVDERKIPFIPAVDLSYLSTQEQKYLLDILIKEEHFNVTLKQSAMLKAISQKGNLTYEKINKIIRNKIYQPPSKVKISYKKIKDYFPADITPKQLEALIIEALELWSKHKTNQKKEA